MTQKLKKILEEFAEKSPTLVLSTCASDKQPQSSVIYFGMDEDLYLYFFSKEGTNKSRNIEKNPKIALLAQDAKEQLTLQMEGVVEKITGEQEILKAFDIMMKALSGKIDWPPPAGKINAGKLTLYRVKLTWARVGHFKDHETDLFENLIV